MPPKGGDGDLTPEAVLAEVSTKMDRTVDAFKRDLTQLRTGRATPALVENMEVSYYGTMTPLKQIASISAPDSRAIMIQPWDARLSIIKENSLGVTEMAKELGRPKTALSGPLKELLKKGYAEKLPNRKNVVAYHRINDIIKEYFGVKKHG